MIGKAPVRLAQDSAHLFEVGPPAAIRAIAWNVSLRVSRAGTSHARPGPGQGS
jgi:hypothetical protein